MLPASSAYIALNMGTASGDMAARNSARLRDLDIWYHSAIWPPSSKSGRATVVAIGQRIAGLVESLFPDIENVRLVHRVAPAQVFVVADSRKRRAEERRAGHIPARLAVHV